jgi:hypothetical protein
MLKKNGKYNKQHANEKTEEWEFGAQKNASGEDGTVGKGK